MFKFLARKKAYSSFERLINDFHEALFKHALWMTGNHDVASDMVQETYFQAWQSIDSLLDEKKALPWLLTILRRTVYREHRCQYRQLETAEQLGFLIDSDDPRDECTVLDLYNAFEKISIDHREIFLLHHLQGFTYEEISEQLDIPSGTVMSRLARARKAMQNELNTVSIPNVISFDPERQEYKKNEK